MHRHPSDSPGSQPDGSPSDGRVGQFIFVGLGIAYLFAVFAASKSPGPLAWGLHSLGFLQPSARLAVEIWLLVAILLTLWGCLTGPASPWDWRLPARLRRIHLGPGLRRAATVLLLLAFCSMLCLLRVRTHFLGDGVVWLTILKTGQHQVYSEPLAAAVWMAFAWMIHALGMPSEASTFGLLSVFCGGIAFFICLALARRLAPEGEARVEAFVLLLTLGTTQLYCGYLESYPPAIVLILAYLWLGLRSLNGRGSFVAVSVLLSLATATHFLALYLWPSYIYLVIRRGGSALRRTAWCLMPAVLTAVAARLAGSDLHQWRDASGVVGRAIAVFGTTLDPWKPYAPFSVWHAVDLGNELLLVMPIVFILAIAALAVPAARNWLRTRDGAFLTIATLSGLLAAGTLVLPNPPAQDWDLIALLLIPGCVLGVGLGTWLLRASASRPFRIGVLMLSVGAILPFLLVNASEHASLERFKTLIDPRAKLSVHGRAYPNGLLAEYYEDRRDYRSALVYAERALQGELTNPRYWVKVGSEHFQLGEYGSAAQHLDEGIRRGWDRAATRHDLGLCYSLLGRHAEAIGELRRAVEMPEGASAENLHDLGVAYERAGYADSARIVWTRVLQHWPGFPPTIRSLRSHFGSEVGR